MLKASRTSDMSDRHASRFEALDGLRGLAAIAVMVYHYTLHNGLNWLGGAWVAVDLFFVLSGFVIAHSYGAKIMNGMTFRTFILLRIIRLAPLYVFALILGLVAAVLVLAKAEAPETLLAPVLKAFALGFVGMPYFNAESWPFGSSATLGSVFPLNEPSWSLFFEMFANICFFFWVAKYRRLSSAILVGCAVGIFVVSGQYFQVVNPGWGTQNFALGFTRVTAGFFCGALIYSAGLHRMRFPTALTIVFVFLTLLAMWSSSHRVAKVSQITLVPLTVVLLSTSNVSGLASSICKWLGDISYPLYILHFPVYRLAYELFLDAGSIQPLTHTLLIGCASTALAVLVVTGDLQLRKQLQRRLLQ